MELTSSDYYLFCDNLWRDWVAGTPVLDGPLSKQFPQIWCPEPYLKFGTGEDPIYFLFTNPGAGNDHHMREYVFRRPLALDPRMPYSQIASQLANWYEKNVNNAAIRRIQAMMWLQEELRKSSIVQFESIPFHSQSLPGKPKLLQLMQCSQPLREYHQHLHNALEGRPVIALTAIGTGKSISKQAVLKSPWLRWQAGIMGLDLDQLEIEPLVRKGRKTTSGFAFSHSRGLTSGIVLMMGSNSFPGNGGLAKIARIMKTHSTVRAATPP